MGTYELPKREIKFRAWDRENCIMVGTDYEGSFSYRKDEYYYDWVNLELTLIEDFAKNERFILMQYTGLKDKNGVNIYEGDIVKKDLYRYPTIIKRENRLLRGNVYGYIIADDCEVIGNVFENPELIDL